MGFIAAAGSDRDRRWIDWRVVDWVMGQSERKRETGEQPGPLMALRACVGAAV
jgi:hypothetical protein